MSHFKTLKWLSVLSCLALASFALAQTGTSSTSSGSETGMSSDTGNQGMSMSDTDRYNRVSTDQVREAQKKLSGQGFDAGPADGIIGKKTTHAIRQFQQAKNQPVTGTLDQKTLSALGIQAAGQMPQQPPGLEPGMTGNSNAENQPGTSGTTDQSTNTQSGSTTTQPGTQQQGSDTSGSNTGAPPQGGTSQGGTSQGGTTRGGTSQSGGSGY